MSNLNGFIDFIQNLSSEDVEINNLVKEVEELYEDNAKCEKRVEELEAEETRLIIERYKMESLKSQYDFEAVRNVEKCSVKIYHQIEELKRLLSKLDFTKILKCQHMELEAKALKEWQPLKERIASSLRWHELMEQRFIVQKYRKAEVLLRETEEANQKKRDEMNKTWKESMNLYKEALEKRNSMIVNIIKGVKEANSLKEKISKLEQYEAYIETLKQEHLQLNQQLETTELGTFNAINKTNNTHSFCDKLQNRVTTMDYMPKFPSFNDILKTFTEPEIKTIVSLESTTTICVKSILNNSNHNQTITATRQTKNVRFNLKLENKEKDVCPVVTESDVEIEQLSVSDTDLETNENISKEQNLQESKDLENETEIETIDLLTPAAVEEENVNETDVEAMESTDCETFLKPAQIKAPLIEIQDCIVLKTPFPVQDLIQENQYSANSSKALAYSLSCPSADKDIEMADETKTTHCETSVLKSTTNSSFSHSSSGTELNKISNTTKKSFYGDFFKFSSAESSPEISVGGNNANRKPVFKDFETFFGNTNDFSFTSKESNEADKAQKNQTAKKENNKKQEFLDFGSSTGFGFDSDDMMEGYKTPGNLDFM